VILGGRDTLYSGNDIYTPCRKVMGQVLIRLGGGGVVSVEVHMLVVVVAVGMARGMAAGREGTADVTNT